MTPFLEKFADYLRTQDRADHTIRGYLADLQGFANWFTHTNGESFVPQAVTPSDVREYRQYLLSEKRRKASTVNRHLAALSVFLEWAVQSGLLEHNPSQTVRGVPQVSGGPKYLDKKGQYALQRAIEKDLQVARLRYPKRWRARQRDASLVTFMLHTGLRLQETLDVCLDDLAIYERKGQVIVREGKGGRQRTVPLNADARKAVQDWLAVRPSVRENPHLWIAVEGEFAGGLTGRSVQRVLRRYRTAAGLPTLTPHVLRHSFAKNLVDCGIGLEKVAALLGHASLNTTRMYVTPNQQDLEKAVEKISTTT